MLSLNLQPQTMSSVDSGIGSNYFLCYVYSKSGVVGETRAMESWGCREEMVMMGAKTVAVYKMAYMYHTYCTRIYWILYSRINAQYVRIITFYTTHTCTHLTNKSTYVHKTIKKKFTKCFGHDLVRGVNCIISEYKYWHHLRTTKVSGNIVINCC